MYYVYILAHPNNRPFYVGKGKGDRIHQHEKEARKGCPCQKCRVIRRIWQQGKEVCKYIVYTTEVSAEAYAFEAELVRGIGRHRLTNLVDGGGGVRNLDPRSAERARQNRTKTMRQRAEESAQKREEWRAFYQDRERARLERMAQREAEAERREEERRAFYETHKMRWLLDRTLYRINDTRSTSGAPMLTPEKIAADADVPLAYLYALLNNTASGLRYRECGRLCRYLGIGVDDLIGYVPTHSE